MSHGFLFLPESDKMELKWVEENFGEDTQVRLPHVLSPIGFGDGGEDVHACIAKVEEFKEEFVRGSYYHSIPGHWITGRNDGCCHFVFKGQSACKRRDTSFKLLRI